MKPDQLEAALRKLWTKSQVPFDRQNLSAYTGLEGKSLDRRLNALVKAGTIGIDVVDGEIQWTMPDGDRPFEGPESLARFERLEKMRAEVKARVRAEALARRTGKPVKEVDSATAADDSTDDGGDGSILATGTRAAKGAMSIVSNAAGKLDHKAKGGRKSVAASAALSLMGPLGWLYAGSFREAVPAAALFALFAWIIPSPILWPLLWFILPVSALAGAAYAWQYNRGSERRTLILPMPDEQDS